MKIPRYTAGQTNNVSLIQEGNRSLRTPAQAAAAAGAPYRAASDIAFAATDAISAYDEVRTARKMEDAKVVGATMEAERNASKLLLDNDPALQQKMEDDPTYYESQIADIELQYRDALNNIEDPEIRERYRKAQKISLIEFRSKAQSSLMDLENKIGKDNVIEKGAAAEQAGLFDEAEDIYAAGDIYLTETEKANINQRIHNGRVDVASDEIAALVDDAYELGGEDAARAALGKILDNDELDDDVQEKALTKSSLVLSNRMKADKTERTAIDLEEAQAKSKLVNAYELYGITTETKDSELDAFADVNELTHTGRQKLFAIRNKKLQAGQSIQNGDPNSKPYRDSLDFITQGMMVEGEDGEPVPMPIEQQFDQQISMVGDRFVTDDNGEQVFVKGTNAIGTNLTNSMIMDAASPEPEVNLRGLKRYAEIITQNPSTKMALDTDTRNFYQAAFASAKNQGGGDEAFAQAAKEQRAIHVTKAQGIDSVKIATQTFNDYIVPDLFEDVGDTLEQLGIDKPGTIWDTEIQFGAQFQAVLLRAGLNISQYQQATQGRIDPASVKRQAYERAVGTVSANFLNNGVPSGGQTFLTNKGLQESMSLEPQLSVNTIDGANTPEGSKALRTLMRDDYVENGTGLNGKKVKYNGEEYTLKAKRPKSKMRTTTVPGLKMGFIPEEKIEENVIYIDDIEMFTGATPRADDNGKILADLRYQNMPIYSITGNEFEAWNGYTSDGYFVPEGKTDVSGGPTRADVNPRIEEALKP